MEQPQDPTTVEFATLVLPSHAAEEGLEAGEGDQVVLEAEKSTLDNLALHDANLTAVVDLEILSELVGVSEEEFIADLHLEMAENRVFSEDVDVASTAASDADVDVEEGEQQPLLGTSTTSGTEEVISDRVTLAADPFIESLAETLAETNTLTPTPLATIHEKAPLTTTSTTLTTGDAHEAAATKTDDDQHLAHDAFLINIPNEAADGELQDHFVLALPEIRMETSVSVMSDVSSHAGGGGAFPLLQKALSLLPTELPSDVVDIQLQAHHDLVDTTTMDGTSTVVSGKSKQDSISMATAGMATITSGAPPHMELHLDLVVQRKVPVIGYVILISGLVALASVGAALDLQQGPSPVMKTLWRQLATSLVLSPLVLKSVYYDGFPQLTRHQWSLLPLAAAAYAYMCTAFVVALEYTTMANAFVLSNMTSLVIIVGRAVLGLPILRAEGMGALVGFTGAAVCANASASPTAVHADPTLAMLGNAVALSASFGTAIYLIFAKSLRSSLDIFVFMFSVMLMGSGFLILYLTLSGEEYSWDQHPDKGLFGWLLLNRADRLPLELFMAVVCNCLGTTGYIAVMKYFEPIVPASVMLMEPVVGSLLGTLAGTAPLPGAQTWFGDAIVAAGTFLVIWSGSKKTETIEATEALRISTDDDASTVVSLMKSPMITRRSSQRKSGEDAPSAKVVWDS